MQTQQIYKHVTNNDRITSHVGRYDMKVTSMQANYMQIL